MAFFELDDVFTYQDANDIKKLWASDTAPADPGTGEVWLDTSSTPNKLKRYNGSSWDIVGELTAADLLNLIKTVDGSGSGLDADKLDGIESSQLARTDTDVEFQGSVRFQVGEGLSIADGGNWTSTPSLGGHTPNDVRLIRIEDANQADADGAFIIGGYGPTPGTPTLSEYLYIHSSIFEWKGNKIWHAGNDGSSSGLDADKLDGLEATSFIRSDTNNNVTGHTEWQDGYNARFGNDADLRIQHTGTTSYIDNYTGNLYVRQLSNGSTICVQVKNTSGTNKNLLLLDADYPKVQAESAFFSNMYSETIANNDVFITNIDSNVVGSIYITIATNWKSAIFHTRFTSSTSLNMQAGSSAKFSQTKDTAGCFNVYFESGKLCVQNKYGSSQTIKIGFFGIKL